MSIPIGRYSIEGVPSPFPCNDEGNPDLPSTLQFISAAISHSELGLHGQTILELTNHPDRVFARNLASVLKASIPEVAQKYDEVIQALCITSGEHTMNEVSEAAVNVFFGNIQANQYNDSAVTTAVSPEDKQELVNIALVDLEIARLDVLNATDSDRETVVSRYEEELINAVEITFNFRRFDLARELSRGALSIAGKQRLRSQFDTLVHRHIVKSLSSEELMDARSLVHEAPMDYAGMTLRKMYDKCVIEATRRAVDIEELQILSVFVDEAASQDMRFEMKQVFDRKILELLQESIRTCNTSRAGLYCSMFKTEHYRKVGKELHDS